jgi:hypothetical protein
VNTSDASFATRASQPSSLQTTRHGEAHNPARTSKVERYGVEDKQHPAEHLPIFQTPSARVTVSALDLRLPNTSSVQVNSMADLGWRVSTGIEARAVVLANSRA